MNIYFKVLSYLIAIGVVLGGLWWYGNTKYDEGYAVRESLQVEADLIATNAARITEQGWQSKLNEAQNAATQRETKLKSDAAAASATVVILRNKITAINSSLPSLTRDAVNQYAAVAGDVFAECTDRYSRLAETTDSINNDRQTLIDGWPRQ